jgi:general secretion pathway protein G
MKPKYPITALRTQAFTLFEMILVLAIIAILIGLGVYHLKDTQGTAEILKARADAKTISMTLTQYKVRHSRLPTQGEGLALLANAPDGSSLIDAEGLVDPWGQPYQYRNPSKKNKTGFDIFSAGPDMKPDTQDDVY